MTALAECYFIVGRMAVAQDYILGGRVIWCKVRVQEKPVKYLAVREGFLNKTDGISVVEGKRRIFQFT